MPDFFLADDLSGALDAAAAFHRAGRAVRIALSPDAPFPADPTLMWGITTETRNAPPEVAAAAVRQLLARAQQAGSRLVYKKIDSTLRGPVAAELRAVMAASPGLRVLFAPANPAVGRTVERGSLHVHGVPVAETAFGRDPVCPLRTSVVREILGGADPNVSVPDTRSPADLEAAVAAFQAAGNPWVAVGSGALAVPVARRLAGGPGPQGGNPPAVPASPVLFLGGSAHPLNREQSARVRQRGAGRVFEIDCADPRAEVDSVVGELERTGSAIVQLPQPRTTPARALAAMTAAASEVMTRAGVARVFATGGETAFALCTRLGITELALVDEIEPGLSLSVGVMPARVVAFAIKPGGFGDADTWVRAWTRLRAL